MKVNASKQHIASSVLALLLAGAMIIGSFMTVAAAVTSTDSEIKATENGEYNNFGEYELANGDLLVTKNSGFDFEVDVLDANTITIDNCGDIQTVNLAKGTVADALKKAGITLADNQIAVPSEKTSVIGDTEIRICNAKEINVTADGETTSALVPYGNIREALTMAGYNLSEDDILSVNDNAKTETLSNVTIQRVTYGEETTNETIAYTSSNKNSDEVELGTTKVKTEGKNGEKLVTRKCKYIDGKKVSEEVIDSKTIKKPVNEVILVGTKGAATSGGAGTFTDMYGNTIAYSQVLTGSGTAYTAPVGAGTATGVPAYHGGVAVNPNIIPYGSKLYIESTDGSFVYGYATAVDTGGALMSGTAIVDCFYNTYGECVNFGRRNVNVYVIG